MATPDEIRLLMHLNSHDKDDKSLKDHLLEQLSSRELGAGSVVRCEWCGKLYTKARKLQKFCEPKCKSEFHMYAGRILKTSGVIR